MPFSYQISLPKTTKWQPALAQDFVLQLFANYPDLVFRIVANSEHVRWEIIEPSNAPNETFRRAILASYPEAYVEIAQPTTQSKALGERFYRMVARYIYVGATFLAPFRGVKEIKEADPLAAISQAMSQLRGGEQVIYSLHISGAAPKAVYEEGYRDITQDFKGNRVSRYVNEVQWPMDTKHRAKLFLGTLFIQADAADEERVQDILVPIDNQISWFAKEGQNRLGLCKYSDPFLVANSEDVWRTTADFMSEQTLAYRPPTLFEDIGRLFGKQPPAHLPRWYDSLSRYDVNRLLPHLRLVLEPDEIAALWHLPYASFSASSIVWAKKPDVQLPAPVAYATQGIRLGTGVYRDQELPVLLSPQVRTSHVSIVGKTRTGKSNLLHHLIHQDIAAGLGVTVIDPHGDLVRDLLRTSIPPEREDDVVILDIADTEHPPALNLLATASADKSLTTAGELADILAMVYGDMRDAPRAKNTLTSALATIWQDDHATLLDVTRLFEEPGYRQRLVKQFGVENIRLLQFWKNYENQSDAMQEQISAPVTYRMQALYGNPALLPITCHPNHIDFSQLVAENRIILVSLKVDNKIIPEEDQNLLGAMIVAAFQHSVQARASNRLFSLYVDEAQRFVTTSLPTLFAEAGKRGISVTLANQFYKQLAGETLDAVMGNVGSIIAFRSGMEDARVLASYLKPAFDVDDLVQMENYHAAVWMQQAAFSLTTDPPLPAENEACARREGYLRQHSRERYIPMTREAILKWIQTRYIDVDDQSNQPDDPRYDLDADGKS